MTFCWKEKSGIPYKYCMLKKGHKGEHQFAVVRMSPEVKNLVEAIHKESKKAT